MKKFIFPLFVLISFLGFSQEIQQSNKAADSLTYKREIAKNELSIGALNLVAFGALDVAYERIINRNSSWAVEAFVLALNRDSEYVAEAYDKDFSLTGKYKYFFGERATWGFYVNGLAMISTGDTYRYDDFYYNTDPYINNPNGTREDEKYTDFALGFGLGGKFVSKQGFFLDLGTGIGRNLLSDNSPTVVGQFNVNLGFRF